MRYKAMRHVWIATKYAIGVIFAKAGRGHHALRQFEEILALDRRHSKALAYAAWLAAHLGELEKSVAFYLELTVLAPTSVEPYAGLGTVLQRLGQHEAAVEAFSEALRLDPAHDTSLFNIGLSLVKAGRHTDATLFYRRLANRSHIDPEVLGNLGATFGEMGEWEQALELSKKAAALAPTAIHLHNLGTALFETERYIEAEPVIRRALELEPDSIPIKTRLALTLAELDKSDEAAQLLRELSLADPSDVVIRASLVGVLFKVGRVEEAMRNAKALVATEGHHAISHETLAWLYLQVGRAADAVASYEKAIETDPSRKDLFAWLGAALSSAHRHAEAVKAFKETLGAQPNYLSDYPELAECYHKSRSIVDPSSG